MAETQRNKLERIEKELLELKLKMAEMKGEIKVLREHRGWRGYPWYVQYDRATLTNPYTTGPTTDRMTCGDNINTCVSNNDTFSVTSDSSNINPLWGGAYNHVP